MTKTTKALLCILCCLAFAGALLSWRIRESTRARLEKISESYAQRTEELNQWTSENAVLSNQLARASSSNRLSDEAFLQLLRLRNKVGQLYRAKAEADALRATNAQLLQMLGDAETNLVSWRGADLKFAGFADPESALRTTLFAWITGDPSAFLASTPPEAREALKEAVESAPEGVAAARFKMLSAFYAPATNGVRVLGKRIASDTEAVVDLYFEGDGKSREFMLKNFNGEWRVTGLIAIFN